MRKMHAAIVALVLAILLSASFERAANARGFGFGVRSLHSAQFRSWYFAHYWRWGRYYGALGRWPQYNGVVSFLPDALDDFDGYAPPATAVFLAESPSIPTCHRSQETVTVPSEEGGTQQITITRCAR